VLWKRFDALALNLMFGKPFRNKLRDRGGTARNDRSHIVVQPCACRKSNTHIQMMKSAKKWRRQDATDGMYYSRRRRVLVD
jgi:hypothetical protein